MKIIKTGITRGANTWSVIYPRLIVLTIRTDAKTNIFNNLSDTPYRNLLELFPSVNGKLSVADIIEEIIMELLRTTNQASIFSKTRIIDNNLFEVIYSYKSEATAGLYVGEAALEILNRISENMKPDLTAIHYKLTDLSKKHELGATSAYILGEPERRGIPLRRFQHTSLFTLGHGSKQHLIRTAVTDSTSGLGIEVAGDKDETKQLLASANVPVPKGVLVMSEQELEQALSSVKFPLVTKPLDGNQGRGVTTHIYNLEQALFGYHIAKKISDTVIVEEFVEGDDYRFLVINYKLVAVTRRTPAMVMGDGTSTIRQLIDTTNLDPARGHGSDHVLAPIKVDKITEKVLNDNSVTLDTVLPDKKILFLKETANISAGGTATDVTDEVDPFTIFTVERIAKLFKLNLCGIDIMMKDISKPLDRENGAIIEVNAGPGIRMHTNPQIGVPRNVAAPIIDMLFPQDNSWKIPVIAVSDNGQLARLISHIAAVAGYQTGYTSPDGLYTQNFKIAEGDFSLNSGADDLLFDPSIDFAVLNCDSKSIIESGLGFETCDVSVLTGLSNDLSMRSDEIEARSIIGKRTTLQGYTIISADEDPIFGLNKEVSAHLALFSARSDNPFILKHVKTGGLATFIENGELKVIENEIATAIMPVDQIPLFHSKQSKPVTDNLLAASLAAHVYGIKNDTISQALKSFM